ncbi:hypothetical protein ACWGI8_32165 [Streptomyces sp. NPDC054841]
MSSGCLIGQAAWKRWSARSLLRVASWSSFRQKSRPGITFLRLARTPRVSNWLVYAEGLREHIEEAIKKQSGAAQREAEAGSDASAESLAADLELATAELRILRAERDRLTAGMARLRETEAERDQLREALKETEGKLESTLKESRSSSSHRAEK